MKTLRNASRSLVPPLLAASLVLVHVPVSLAALDIFLCIPGQRGNATSQDFDGCSTVRSYSQTFGVKGAPCRVTIIKDFDGMSQFLSLSALKRTSIEKATVTFRDDNKRFPFVPLEITLLNFRVLQTMGSGESGGKSVIEEVMLTRSKVSALSITRREEDGGEMKEDFACAR